MDCFDLSTHNIHVVSTENSVVSSSQNTATDLRAVKKLSSGASTVTSTSASTSSCGISNFADERKEDMDGSENFASAALQDVKPRTPAVLQMNAPPHPIAEFLFQLTKMLTDDNREFIEWRKATIFVHDPAVSLGQLLFLPLLLPNSCRCPSRMYFLLTSFIFVLDEHRGSRRTFSLDTFATRTIQVL